MSPFVVLGVPHDVDDAALKKAYFRKVREHPPETDPEKFQAVQDAFEQLRDPDRRRAATEPEVPARLVELMSRAQRSSDPKTALATLQQAIDEFPHFIPVQVMQVSCLSHLKPADGLAAARALARRFENDLEVHLLLAHLEQGEPRRAALAKARELAPRDRRPLFEEAQELIALKRWDEALGAIDAALKLTDRRFVPDAQLEGARLRIRVERNEPLQLEQAGEELAPTLVSVASQLIRTRRTLHARALLDKAQQLQPKRPPIPFGPARHLPVAQLPEQTRAYVEQNAQSPSMQTVQIRTVVPSKKWVAKPVWWCELRRLHLIVRRASGVQVCPLLSLELQQREGAVPLLLCDGADAGLGGMPELAFMFEAALERRERLLQLMSKDLLETEQLLEPLQWRLA